MTLPPVDMLSKEEIREMIEIEERYRRNREYLRRNYRELRKKYGGRVVVIIGESVVDDTGFTDDPEKIEKFFKELEERFGDQIRGACIEYIPKPGEWFIYEFIKNIKMEHPVPKITSGQEKYFRL